MQIRGKQIFFKCIWHTSSSWKTILLVLFMLKLGLFLLAVSFDFYIFLSSSVQPISSSFCLLQTLKKLPLPQIYLNEFIGV